MIDQAKIRALKERRGIFAAFGQSEKVKAVDAELAKMRREADKIEVEEHVEMVEDDVNSLKVLEPSMETAEADLTGVETAAVRRPRGRPRKS